MTRRPTGGGTIHHDHVGDIVYSLVLPAAAVSGDLTESYHTLCTPVFDALDRLGVDARYVGTEQPSVFELACSPCGLHSVHDVVGPDRRELAGNAQYRAREAVAQHGSVSFARASDAHRDVFTDCPVDDDTFAVRVGAITDYADCPRVDTVGALETTPVHWTDHALDGSWTEAELVRSRRRARENY